MDQEIQKQPSPWAKRKEIGLFKALFQTIKLVLFSPGDFFANLEIEKSRSNPFYFYFIVVLFATAFSLLWSNLFFKNFAINPLEHPLQLLFVPVIVVGSLYIGAAIIHLGVMIFKGKGGFRGTFNVLSYAAAGRIFSIVPIVGDIVGGIWSLTATIIGFKKIHKLSTARAIFVYLLIILILFILLMVLSLIMPQPQRK